MDYKKYIDDYLTIFENNLQKNTPKDKRIPLNKILEMVSDLNTMFEAYFKEEPVKASEMALKRYIPLLDLMLKLDKNNAEEYEKYLHTAYKIASRTSLEHYFIYREWGERKEDKFFAPRFEIMRGYIHYLQEIVTNPNFKMLIVMMPSGYGKLLANDTPILTKDGWKKHGDLKVGDYVINPKGEFIKVTMVHPKRYATYKVTFEDGEEILCHNQHEWQVYDKSCSHERHLETNDMIGNTQMKDGRNRFYAPIREAIIGEEKQLPVEPYTYGVWLGDGSKCQARITQSEKDNIILKHIPYKVSSVSKCEEGTNFYYFEGLANDLHKLDLCYQKHKEKIKYINDMYLTASINQRLELLAGLIDTDGYLDKKKNRYIIVTAEERLRDDISSLISTFGWRVSITTVSPTTSTSGITAKRDTYYIGFSPDMIIPCKLERKQTNKICKKRRIGIKSITLLDKLEEGNCITVEGGLYLAGRSMKVTHNTYPEKISEAWAFGIDPTGTVLALCSNEDVVKGGSSTVRNEMKTEWFGEVFPNMKYSSEDKDYFAKETDGNWKLRDCKLGSSYIASTVKSNVVGVRASQRIHIDDLYPSYIEAMSQKTNEEYYNKFTTVWRKRFVQNKTPKVVVSGTLWASGDFISLLVTEVTSQYKFKPHDKYKYTYINEDESIAICRVPALDYQTGRSTCPELRTTLEIEEEKRKIPDYLFQTNFQQKPVDPESMMFSWGRLQTYEKLPRITYEGTYAVIDANRRSGRDFFSMPIFQRDDDENGLDYYYLKDCIYTQTATKDLYNDICKKIVEHHITTLIIESNVSSELSQNLTEMLKNNGVTFCDIREKYNTAVKETRIIDQSYNILKRLFFPTQNNVSIQTDLGMFMNELTTYNTNGRNEHDDATDSCAFFTREIVERYSMNAKVSVFKRPF